MSRKISYCISQSVWLISDKLIKNHRSQDASIKANKYKKARIFFEEIKIGDCVKRVSKTRNAFESGQTS